MHRILKMIKQHQPLRGSAGIVCNAHAKTIGLRHPNVNNLPDLFMNKLLRSSIAAKKAGRLPPHHREQVNSKC